MCSYNVCRQPYSKSYQFTPHEVFTRRKWKTIIHRIECFVWRCLVSVMVVYSYLLYLDSLVEVSRPTSVHEGGQRNNMCHTLMDYVCLGWKNVYSGLSLNGLSL